MHPKISLIVPVYNMQPYLPECLASIASQSIFSDLQVLLVDDGSTDGSGRICDDFAHAHENVRVLHCANAGVSTARNAGIDEADGEYLAFVDSDDTIVPDMFERLLAAAVQTGAQLTFCEIARQYPQGDEITHYPFKSGVLLGRDEICGSVANYMNAQEAMNSVCNKIFLRSIVQNNHLRLTDGRKYAEDREFVLRFLSFAEGICYVPFVGYLYRVAAGSATEKARTDYAQTMSMQFAQDRLLLGALGMDETRFLQTGSIGWGARIVAAFGAIEKRMRGIVRYRTMRALVRDPQMQQLVEAVWPYQLTQTRFNRKVLEAIRKKSVFRIRLTLHALRAYIWLNAMRGRGA